MRLGKFSAFGAIAAMASMAAAPAYADNKDKAKRTETPASGEACKPAVKPMSESTPVRKNDCQKTRRILM